MTRSSETSVTIDQSTQLQCMKWFKFPSTPLWKSQYLAKKSVHLFINISRDVQNTFTQRYSAVRFFAQSLYLLLKLRKATLYLYKPHDMFVVADRCVEMLTPSACLISTSVTSCSYLGAISPRNLSRSKNFAEPLKKFLDITLKIIPQLNNNNNKQFLNV
jgi:hypothetical protein